MFCTVGKLASRKNSVNNSNKYENLLKFLSPNDFILWSSEVHLVTARCLSVHCYTDRRPWQFLEIGTISLVRDIINQSYLLKMIDSERGVVWHECLKKSLAFERPFPEFLTIGEHGFSFSNAKEADLFEKALKKCIENMVKEGLGDTSIQYSVINVNGFEQKTQGFNRIAAECLDGQFRRKNSIKKDKRRISRNDISLPITSAVPFSFMSCQDLPTRMS